MGVGQGVRSAIGWVTDERHATTVAWLLFAIALLVRGAGLAILPNLHLSSNARESVIDAAELIRNGRFLWNPDYPMLIPPLTAMVLAGLQSVFGPGLLAIKILQVVLDAATVVVVFHIGRRSFTYPAAVWGSLALTVYPFTVFVPLYIGTEALFTFLLALGLLFFVDGLERGRTLSFVAGGLLLGLATEARGTTLYLPVFLLGLLAWRHRRALSASVARQAVMFLLGFLLIIGPWGARNLVVLGEFIPTSIPGMPLLYGSSEDFWIISDRREKLPAYLDHLAKAKGFVFPERPTWVEKDRLYKAAAMEKYKERLREKPLSFVPFLAHKFARLWYGTESGTNEMIVLLPNLPIYILALVGLGATWRSPSAGVQTLHVLLVYIVLLHVAAFAYFRYIAPVMPFVLLYAAHGLIRLVPGLAPPRPT